MGETRSSPGTVDPGRDFSRIIHRRGLLTRSNPVGSKLMLVVNCNLEFS